MHQSENLQKPDRSGQAKQAKPDRTNRNTTQASEEIIPIKILLLIQEKAERLKRLP